MRDEPPSSGRSEATGFPRRKFLLGAAAAGGAAIVAGGAAIAATSRHDPAAAPIARPTASQSAVSAAKGVGAWKFPGANQALADSGVSWYYTWGPNPDGLAPPANVQFVPMIWGATDVNSAELSQVAQAGNILLGFNEPDNPVQSKMTVAQALSLWPRLMATGMTLGSPAVARSADVPGSWLSQFMSGARARKYRVDFITAHWYGANFDTTAAVSGLESYLKGIYARYGLPIWLTEFALGNEASNDYPTDSQQAAFVTASTSMLQTLPYLQRYAWFALPRDKTFGNTGLYTSGPVATPVGRAYQAVAAHAGQPGGLQLAAPGGRGALSLLRVSAASPGPRWRTALHKKMITATGARVSYVARILAFSAANSSSVSKPSDFIWPSSLILAMRSSGAAAGCAGAACCAWS